MGLVIRGMIAFLILFLVIGGLYFMARGDRKNFPPPNSNPPISNGNPVPISDSEKIILECEGFCRIEDKDPGSGKVLMAIEEANLGEPIRYLQIPDGILKECRLDGRKGQGGDLPGKAWYDFEVKGGGDFFLFLRAKWHDECGDSIYLRLDGGEYGYIEDNEGYISRGNYRWAWHALMEKGNPKVIKLAPGKHLLELNIREDGPSLDKILLKNSPSVPPHHQTNP